MSKVTTQTHYFPETTGLCDIIDSDKNKRLCFFEIDVIDMLLLERILYTYKKYELDVVYHKTLKGWHFISPTLVDLPKWKQFHSELKDINPKCPMICLRVQGNKYPGEDTFFYHSVTETNTMPEHNIKSVCLFLNKIFQSTLQGEIEGALKTVKYKPHIRNHP